MTTAAVAAFLSRLPRCSFAFAYGSAVKPQARAEVSETPMVDLGIAVAAEDVRRWHAENLERNPRDYSLLGRLGAGFVADYQRRFGARVYFNALVPVPESNLLFKYGVVCEEDLVGDLLGWTSLYFAGRLHKPVDEAVAPSASLRSALDANLVSAIRVSLLLLPRRFDRFLLYHTVSDLSYSGDFRMIFGEDKNKVRNIVAPRLDEFDRLYAPALSELRGRVVRLGVDEFERDDRPETRLELLAEAPAALRAAAAAADALDADAVRRSLRGIVLRSSVAQSIKGIPTAGLLKSLRYSARKIRKTL